MAAAAHRAVRACREPHCSSRPRTGQGVRVCGERAAE
jgi:hypothetical protein